MFVSVQSESPDLTKFWKSVLTLLMNWIFNTVSDFIDKIINNFYGLPVTYIPGNRNKRGNPYWKNEISTWKAYIYTTRTHWNVSTLTEVFLHQKRINVREHTVNMASCKCHALCARSPVSHFCLYFEKSSFSPGLSWAPGPCPWILISVPIVSLFLFFTFICDGVLPGSD